MLSFSSTNSQIKWIVYLLFLVGGALAPPFAAVDDVDWATGRVGGGPEGIAGASRTTPPVDPDVAALLACGLGAAPVGG